MGFDFSIFNEDHTNLPNQQKPRLPLTSQSPLLPRHVQDPDLQLESEIRLPHNAYDKSQSENLLFEKMHHDEIRGYRYVVRFLNLDMSHVRDYAVIILGL